MRFLPVKMNFFLLFAMSIVVATAAASVPLVPVADVVAVVDVSATANSLRFQR